MKSYSRSRTRRFLNLESLEGRDVPAVVSVIAVPTTLPASGLLTLTGDDHDSNFTIKVDTNSYTLTPADGSTQIGLAAPGLAVTFPGAVKSLKASLLGGNDTVKIDNASPFVLTGAANFDLGSGTNILNLVTSEAITLGSLSVKGADGDDIVSIAGGVGKGSEVKGAASIDGGNGLTNLNNVAEIKFSGPAGLKLSAASPSGSLGGTFTDVTVTKTVNDNQGNNPGPTLTFVNSTLGGLQVKGSFVQVKLDGTTVNGGVSLKSNFAANLTTANTTKITGDVSLNGDNFATIQTAGSLQANNVSVTGKGYFTNLKAGGSFVAANVTVAGNFSTKLESTGAFSAADVKVTSKSVGYATFGATSATITGNLAVSGKFVTVASFATSALSEVTGTVMFKGGSFQSAFSTNGLFQADKDVTLNLGDGTGVATIGDTTNTAQFKGKLTINGGKGADQVALTNVQVTGATNIPLGASGDTLSIENGSIFSGAFTADLGSGDDTVSIAQNAGSAAPVKFNAKATITAKSDNDRLLLGKSGGDAGQTVSFVAGSKIDGGTGFNTFDSAGADFTGITFPADFPNWN